MKRFQRYFWKRELYVSAPLVVLNRLLPNQCYKFGPIPCRCETADFKPLSVKWGC